MKTPTVPELETIIIGAAKEVGQFVRANAFEYGPIEWKSVDDPVTSLDKNAELMVRRYINSRIRANISGEEFGIGNDPTAPVKIYVDPIDGTKSLTRWEFMTSLSIAGEIDGKLSVGCVYDFMRDILYVANDKNARVEFNGKVHQLPMYNDQMYSKITFLTTERRSGLKVLSQDKYVIRIQSGSVALTMAQVACGGHDGVIFKPYQKNGACDTADICAGYHILNKAGFVITDAYGRPYDYNNPSHGMIAVKKSLAPQVFGDLKLAA